MWTRSKQPLKRVWMGVFVMLLSGITLFWNLPAQAYPLLQVSTPTATLLATGTATALPTVSPFGDVSISCRFYSDYDREFIVRLEVRPGGPPSGTAVLIEVDGVTTQTNNFTSQTLNYRGPYLELSIQARWPDGASGFAGATCGQIVPTNTPTPPSTPTSVNTPSPTSTSTSVATLMPTSVPTSASTSVPSPSRTRRPQPPEDTATPPAQGDVPPTPGGGDITPITTFTLEPVISTATLEPIVPTPTLELVAPSATLEPIAPTATPKPVAPVATSERPQPARPTRSIAPIVQPAVDDRPVSLPDTGQAAPPTSDGWLLLAMAGLLVGFGWLVRRRLHHPLS